MSEKTSSNAHRMFKFELLHVVPHAIVQKVNNQTASASEIGTTFYLVFLKDDI